PVEGIDLLAVSGKRCRTDAAFSRWQIVTARQRLLIDRTRDGRARVVDHAHASLRYTEAQVDTLGVVRHISREAFKFAKAIGLDRDASARHGFDVTHTVVSRQLRIVVGADRLEGAIAVNRDAGLLKAAIGEDHLWSNCTDSLVPQLRQQRGQ